MSEIKLGSEKMPSVISDPFKKSMVNWVSVYANKNKSNDTWSFHGRVEFENGNTKGEQAFAGSSFDDVVIKIKAMLDSF